MAKQRDKKKADSRCLGFRDKEVQGTCLGMRDIEGGQCGLSTYLGNKSLASIPTYRCNGSATTKSNIRLSF